MPVPMTKDEAHEFLDSRPGFIVLSTIGRNGFPHSVPIGYFRLGEDIYLGGRANTQRIKNVQRNPLVCALLETGRGREIRGLMVQGEAEVIDSPEDVLRLMRESAKQRGTPEAEWPTEPRPGRAFIRLQPRNLISWDYSRDT